MTPAASDASTTTSRTDGAPRLRTRADLPPNGRTERLLRTNVAMMGTGPEARPAATLTTGPWSLDADERATGLSAAPLLDNALATAVRSATGDLAWIVTTELQLNLTGTLPSGGTVLQARTCPVIADRRGGVARGILVGPDGTEYAHATGWFHGVGRNSEEALDHFAHQAARPLGPETEVSLPQLLGMVGGTPARAEVRPEVAEDFRAGVMFREDDGLKNPHGATHGGALTIMAGLAAQQALPDRTGYDLQSLQVRFLRPGSGAIAARTRVRHAGRALRIVEVELVPADPATGQAAQTGQTSPAKPFVEAVATFRAAAFPEG